MSVFFFFNDTATTEIYTLSLHDALPISGPSWIISALPITTIRPPTETILSQGRSVLDRKSTRLNSSHSQISYAVFCLKKKKFVHTVEQRADHHAAWIFDADGGQGIFGHG